jgi:thiamine pyrophosphokinase
LFLFAGASISVAFIQENWDGFIVTDSCVLMGKRDDRVSLIPISEKVLRVSTTGLRYALKRETLFKKETRGISNAMIGMIATVKVGEGKLLVLH